MQSTLVYAKLQDQAIRDAREQGQAKMQELMKAAKKRMKLTAKKQKLLTVARRLDKPACFTSQLGYTAIEYNGLVYPY